MTMEDFKFAQLDSQQLAKINELEKKMGVTLIAYDLSSMPPNNSGAYEENNGTTNNHPSY
ncbi:hypothetical protein IAI09_19620 [Lysinibacillus fusiformis]|nr:MULTISPECIES: hypothetical protein [Lysinibacillus]MBD8523044.1 hypothetical protein [Lysinibacillus fusiformis]MCR8855277.1 hypothetical protein [Lysinibacillus fusiformis]WKT79672.1 hypothetical protein QYY55_18480 [Lysinibacillus fusiformis]